jgi:hypothetical protein
MKFSSKVEYASVLCSSLTYTDAKALERIQQKLAASCLKSIAVMFSIFLCPVLKYVVYIFVFLLRHGCQDGTNYIVIVQVVHAAKFLPLCVCVADHSGRAV